MKTRSSWFVAAALGAAAAAGSLLESGGAQVPPGVMYQAACTAVDEMTVEGFVTNPGNGIIRVDGMVRFTFTVANSMSRPSVSVQVNVLVPPGRTMSVARSRLVWKLTPGETCQLDVSGAIQ
ncbi:MAG: hypothetical protein Q8T11_03815 [Elusimicrobiota bacterium]|nr:hypothetical protein [Elusimicrobiota bacterium]